MASAIGLVGGGASVGGRRLIDVIVEYAERAPTLVVLDNCEHLVDDAADVADELLRGSQNLTILATSREALGTEGERVWRIPSMGADSGDARELFLARATAATSDFNAGPADMELVDRICTQLDGIPLAIELAAARVSHLSLSELEAGLDERFSLLSGGRRARRQRQQTLQAMMDWSWDLLDAGEQRMRRPGRRRGLHPARDRDALRRADGPGRPIARTGHRRRRHNEPISALGDRSPLRPRSAHRSGQR